MIEMSQKNNHHRQSGTSPLPHPELLANSQDASNNMYTKEHILGHACMPKKGRAKKRRSALTEVVLGYVHNNHKKQSATKK